MKRTVIFSVLTVFLIIFIIFAGLPLLVRLATFIADIKSSKELTEKEDSTAPFPPKLHPLPQVINIANVMVKGFAEPGTIVKVVLNSEIEKEIVAEADGNFTAEGMMLSLGKNKIKAYATDQAGNESQESGVMIVEYDNSPPELKIISPSDGSSFSGEVNKILLVGQTEPDVTLKISSRLLILGNEGEFEYSLTLFEGENTITIEAEDRATNKTVKELTLTYSP